MKKLIISAKTKDFRADSPHPKKSNVEFNNIRPSILERDDYTCQYCGFRAKKYQHIHHLDDDHDNNTEENLVTICPLCHMSQHIGIAGVKGMGTLIYLDQETFGDFRLNLSQEKLNHFVRLFWLRQENKIHKDAAIQASDFLKRLEQARVDSDKVIGTCDPILLGNNLREINDENYLKRNDILENIYFLPFKEGFLKEHKYWKAHKYSKLDKQDWAQISKNNMFTWIAISKLMPNLEGIKRFLSIKKIY